MKRSFHAAVTVEAPVAGEAAHGRTRERLLDAAEGLFAERGYDRSSVRDLTAAAGCNLAAVSYHFGGKERLYEDVFRRLLGTLREQSLACIRREMARPGAALEDLIAAFAAVFLEPLTRPGRGRRILLLYARELLEQRLPAELVLGEAIAPVQRALVEAFRRLCPRLPEADARWSAHSLVGQLLWALRTADRFGPASGHPAAQLDLEAMVERVVAGTSAAVRAAAAAPRAPRRQAGGDA